MLHDFSQHVRAHVAEIVVTWMKAVRAEAAIPTAKELSDTELRDHLDGILAKLTRALESAAGGAKILAVVEAPPEAAIHGVVRLRQDYSVEELVREVAVLRNSFLEFFSGYLKSTRQIETDDFLRIMQLMTCFFDEICSESVAAYVQQRDQQTEEQAQTLRALNQSLEETNRQYEEADSSRRRTLRTVAHEMATPVNALGLGVSYLSESDDPAERMEAKNLIARTLEHLRVMLDVLFDYSRVEGAMEKMTVREFAVKPLLDFLVAGFEPSAAAKRIDFTATCDTGLRTLVTDEHKVQRIAVNLLSNAIKYCEKGHVSLALREIDGAEWAIEVEDTGCGIRPEDRDRIFGEFERLPQHSEEAGLGLGLAIVKTLTTRLGGRVELESTVGEGSRFCVILPRVITR